VSVTFQKLATRVWTVVDQDPHYPKLTQQQLMALMYRMFDEIGDALSHGEDVYLEGFGRFYPDCKPPRKVKSGLTAETHMTKFKVFVRFNAFKQLNGRVQRFMHRIGLTGDEETDDV